MKIAKRSKRVYVTVTLPEIIKEQLDQFALRTKRNRGGLHRVGVRAVPKRANQLNGFHEIRSGIYFLCQDKKVTYIGQSRDVQTRVNGHAVSKEFDSVVSMLVPEGLLDEVEQYWIKRIKPELNFRYHKRPKKLPRTTRAYSITVPKDFLPVIKQMAFESGRTVSSYLSNLIKEDTKTL